MRAKIDEKLIKKCPKRLGRFHMLWGCSSAVGWMYKYAVEKSDAMMRGSHGGMIQAQSSEASMETAAISFNAMTSESNLRWVCQE